MSAFKAERDTIAGLGLLAANYVHFDPPVSRAGKTVHTHGFNVHCLVIDNRDGEVLALNRNRIYADEDPLQHAEQVGIREALPRLHVKYPRPVGVPIDEYVRKNLFMEPGTAAEDFLNRGCTLYNTFDPCGFCATTLLVCYMKRIAYLFDDKKFHEVYDYMGAKFFKGRESVRESLSLVAESTNPLGEGARLIAELRKQVKATEDGGTPLVMTLDSQHAALGKAAELLATVKPEHLSTTGEEQKRVWKTAADLRRMLKID